MFVPYRSPAASRMLRRIEESWLAADPEPRGAPFYGRVRVKAPRVLYLNFLAQRDFAAGLCPGCFCPLSLETDPSKTMFSILVFGLEGAHPVWAPAWAGELAPRLSQANWRFYGHLTSLPEGERPGVLFWRTVTDSVLLAVFGRRLARCFPLQRARRMELRRRGREVGATVEPGAGSAPALCFRGCLTSSQEVPPALQAQFPSFAAYTRWVMDQHLSATVWEREVVVQDMHLGLEDAGVVAVEPRLVEIAALSGLGQPAPALFSCFLAENVEVFLDSIRALPRPGAATSPAA